MRTIVTSTFRSERAGQRSISRFITQKLKLKLKVNEAKSAVARPQERTFLGFSFTGGPGIKRTIAPKSLERFRQRIREITRRAKGVSIKTTMEELATCMRGWRDYFGFCETPEVLIALTRWVRLRLWAALWRQWKTPRRRRAALIANGVSGWAARNTAGTGRGPWYLAAEHTYFKSLGLPSLFQSCSRNFFEPPCTDPYPRWCGRGGAARLPPIRSILILNRPASRETGGVIHCIIQN
ncbi:group II intron maturase-specific domain-containing protein [Bradyrhizobium sp. 164]|uniref:group II intron maturase-specific domain-containing protein n=1 Tax=Bradyrhizobium sp. 164 TaxID=2782637 RepID=UPI001FFBE464|nr:group II intron maturase-specific domain-containing protein [Bradyrhizobium sp. 164]